LDLFKKCTKKFFSGNLQPPSNKELKELAEFEVRQLSSTHTPISISHAGKY
jgi:hypothetical protein